MNSQNDQHKLVPQFEALLTELDRLKLPIIAAHVDIALRLLEEIIAEDVIIMPNK